MAKPQHLISCLVTLLLLGCGRTEEKSEERKVAYSNKSPETPVVAKPIEPSVTVASGFQYDEDEPWSKVTIDGAEGKDKEPALRALKAGLEVGVVMLGDHLRIYNVGLGWQPMTLTLLDEDEKPIESFRIDLPPYGVSQAEMPQLASDQVVKLRMTRARLAIEENGAKPILLDRKIGVSAPELTTGSVAELGFGKVEKQVEEGDIQITSTRTQAGVESSTIHNPTESWKSIVLANRLTSHVAHSGNKGNPPSETWWTSTVNEAVPKSE